MLKKIFPYIEEVRVEHGDSWYIVPVDKILETCMALRDNYKFDSLSCLTGTDRGDFLELVYHIYSYERKETITLKTKVQGVQTVQTVQEVWPSANWMERETFDLLGVKFAGHPNLRRILLPEDWEGHPLRKDYKEKTEYCGMTTTR